MTQLYSGTHTIAELRASLARFPAEIATADAEIAAARARAAHLRAALKKAERKLERIVGPTMGLE